MKNKITTIILSVILIFCIGSSIYQYKTTSNLTNSLSLLANTKNDFTTEIESKTEELENTTSEIEKFNTTISELTAEKDSLTASIKETQLKIDTIQQEIKQYQSDKTVADTKMKVTTPSTTDNSGSSETGTDSSGTLPGGNADVEGATDAASWFTGNLQGEVNWNFDENGNLVGDGSMAGVHAE